MDYLTIEHGRTGQDVNILIITDHYSRFAEAVKTSNQTAFTTAQAAYDHFFSKYGFTEKIVTDQGTKFESHLFKDLCKAAKITKLRTTSYHPQGNRNSERFNSTLINMIRTLEQEHKVKWTTHLNTLCSAYNSTVHISTGFSPYWLMVERKHRLVVDLNLGTNLPELGLSSSSKYIQDLERRLQWSYKLAQEHMKKQAEKAKKYYDRRVRCSKLRPGDLVLIKRFGFRGKHKIQDRWENQVYKVLESCHSSPLSSDLGEKMVLVESGLFIGTIYSHSEQRFWRRITQLLLWNLKIATKLEPLSILSKKILEILLRMK